MPNVDGCSLIRKIRQGKSLNRNILAIAITALDREEMFDLILKSGFQACLTKPFEADDLINLIASLHLEKENSVTSEASAA